MADLTLDQDGACSCESARFHIQGRVLTRFLCHCTICQELYRLPYADVVAVRLGTCELEDPSGVTFQAYKPPPALSRGTCTACGAPVVGLLEKLPGVRLAFVPTRNLADATLLPPPGMHIFYHRRVRDIDDDLRKHKGFVRSELAMTKALAAGLLA